MKRLVVAVVLIGCGGVRMPAYPTELIPATELNWEFLMRQRIAFDRRGQHHEFSVVLQSYQGELTLLGISPMGTRSFTIQQRGTRIDHSIFDPTQVALPPEYILNDIHRALFLGIPDVPPADGAHAQVLGGDRVIDRWEASRLRERTFTRLDGEPSGAIRVRYADGYVRGVRPPRIEFDNGWVGYRLVIEIVTYQPLPATSGDDP